MAFAADEERGCARDAAEVGGVQVSGDFGFARVVAQVGGEPFGVQAELAGVTRRTPPGKDTHARG